MRGTQRERERRGGGGGERNPSSANVSTLVRPLLSRSVFVLTLNKTPEREESPVETLF